MMVENRCPFVSVIVPVFNTHSYVEKCLESIRQQTLENIEIICIDDGSTDGSGEFLDEISMVDPRITVIHHHENLGLPMARKTGIHQARAPYIGFVDSDDWIDQDMHRTLYECMRDNDLDFVSSALYQGTVQRRIDSIQKDNLKEKIYTTQEDLEYFFCKAIWQEDRDVYGIIPNTVTKLYRSEILKESCLAIDNRLHFLEDNALVYTYLFRCKRIQILHVPYYHHRYVEDSDSNREDPLFLEHVNALYTSLKHEAEQSDYQSCIAEQIENMIVWNILTGMNKLMGFSIFNHVIPRFPLRKLQGKRVAVYGAGIYGINTIKRIEKTYASRYPIRFIGLVDRAMEGELKGYPIYKVQDLDKLDFDYLLIAVKSGTARKEILEDLCRYSISSDKIMELF